MRAVRLLACGALAWAACGGAAPPPVAPPTVATAEPEAPVVLAEPEPLPDCPDRIARAPLDQVRALVEAEGCNGHAWDEVMSVTPLMKAAKAGDAELLSFLIDRGVWIDFRAPSGGSAVIGKTALWFAVQAAHPEVVARLLAAGADPNQYPDEGVPLLFLAASHDDLDTARMLVEAGADPTHTTMRDQTVMTWSNGPGARVFAYLLGLGVPTDGLTQDQIDALLWEASHQPAADASIDDRVAFLIDVLAHARVARSRGAAIKALGALGTDATAAVPALIDVALGDLLGASDWSAVYAADALLQIGWTAALDRELPALLKAIPGAAAQRRIAIVELIATKGPASKAVIAALRRLADDGPDRELGVRAVGILLARTDVELSAAVRRKLERLTAAASSN